MERKLSKNAGLGVDDSTIIWYILTVRLALKKIDSLCRERHVTTAQLLRESGVSRNAFYALGRKKSVVPQSLIRIARHLDVPVSALLDDTDPPRARIVSLLKEVRRISRKHRGADPENIRHTLLLLDDEPVERLRRALRRGRPLDIR